MTDLLEHDRTALLTALGHPGGVAPAWARALVDAASTVDVGPGTTLLEHGDGALLVVLSGRLEVRVDGRLVAHPGAGAVIGALRGRTLTPPGLAVASATTARVAVVPDDAVRGVIRRDVAVADTLHALVALTVVGREAAAGPDVAAAPTPDRVLVSPQHGSTAGPSQER